MPTTLRIAGILLALVGLVWGLQGVGFLGGSVMTGQPFWAGAGLLSFLVGISILFLGARRSKG
ncbi:MAG: hypothetical protein EXR50_08755 [Dehalococcoidia bacterium]|nr:hypothetical protein [Dehalococcoidia bacterium]